MRTATLLRTPPPTQSAAALARAVLDSLKPLKGADFDKAYISKVGLEGHKQAIAAFEKEVSDGQNADLKKAAQKALPTIKEHYQMAQRLASKKGVAE
jgi:putative membrane protein